MFRILYILRNMNAACCQRNALPTRAGSYVSLRPCVSKSVRCRAQIKGGVQQCRAGAAALAAVGVPLSAIWTQNMCVLLYLSLFPFVCAGKESAGRPESSGTECSRLRLLPIRRTWHTQHQHHQAFPISSDMLHIT